MALFYIRDSRIANKFTLKSMKRAFVMFAPWDKWAVLYLLPY